MKVAQLAQRSGGVWFFELIVSAPGNVLLGDGIPELQPQAGDDVVQTQRRHYGSLQFFDRHHCLGKPVERDLRIQVMHVVVADISREPAH